MTTFSLKSSYALKGDQLESVTKLTGDVNKGTMNQVLLGVTGSGKTFSIANVIQRCQKTSLIMVHNKILAAQLYNEMKDFFPNNAVEYFVSYYDYYQPEAYIPQSNTYIDKDVQINDQIDLMRHSATRSLLERKDVIIISSVSCIYGLGAPKMYLKMSFQLNKGNKYSRKNIITKLVDLQYRRMDLNFARGGFRVRGENFDIFPSHHDDIAWKIVFNNEIIEQIYEFDYLTGKKLKQLNKVVVFGNSHYITPRSKLKQVIKSIKLDLKERVQELKSVNKIIESQRITQKTNFDLEMILETGSCKGIENYSRYLFDQKQREAPSTLFQYLPKNSLLFVDESHVTIPQIKAMYNGDYARKKTLVEHGFRLPSALDNRPLTYDEWDLIRPQTIFVSATPGLKELNYTGGKYVEQLIRPTGLLDPICEVRSCKTQVDNLVGECKIVAKNGNKVLITTLSKKMAEELTHYLDEVNIKAVYIHSDIKTLKRVLIIEELRKGKYDVLIGVNLLREGLDIPECSLVLILDADKEGFLRSETSLIQTIGRAARNSEGRVILYADTITNAIKQSLQKTSQRRKIQAEYNEKNRIIPTTIKKKVTNSFNTTIQNSKTFIYRKQHNIRELDINKKKILQIKQEMLKAAQDLEFEKAAQLRDIIKYLERETLTTL